MIKAVLIDIDDTLLDFKRSAEVSIIQSQRESGITLPEGFIDVFITQNDAFWLKIERGEMTKEELHRVRWATIFRLLGIDGDGEAFDDLFRKNLNYACIKVDGAEELLKYLSRYRLYGASNAHAEDYQKGRLLRAGLLDYFDGVFVSGAIGANKPSKEFFDRCMQALGEIIPDEVVMIGDSLTADVKGARDYGFNTIWLDRYGKAMGGEADYTAHTLKEVEDIMRRHYE